MGEFRFQATIAAHDAPHAEEAAARLAVDRPDLTISTAAGHVLIAGSGDEAPARLAWRCALLNERCASDAGPKRAEMLRALFA